MRAFALPVAFALLITAGSAMAADLGTPDEAKAMLEETVVEMKADPAGTIAKINAGEMKNKDLYPFCGGPDGMVTAHPSAKVRTMSLKDLKDKKGKPFGAEMYDKAKAGEIAEVSYMWPRPGGTEPVEKVTFVTMVGDQVCGVGYYK